MKPPAPTTPSAWLAAGWNMVRMAEFAWDLIEPQPGQYDFSLFDQTIQRLGEQGIVTMLCTPTATPPRWLTYAYPEMLRVDANGVRMQHGSRQQACYANHGPARAFAAHHPRDGRALQRQPLRGRLADR